MAIPGVPRTVAGLKAAVTYPAEDVLPSRSSEKLAPVLSGRASLAPFPMHKVRRVNVPTVPITGAIERIDMTRWVWSRAEAGEFGRVAKRESSRVMLKHPLSYAQSGEISPAFMPIQDGEVHPSKSPLPADPAVLSNHIKSLGYFLSADVVGICELPQWAVYKRDWQRDPIVCTHKYAIVVCSAWDYQTFAASSGDDWITDAEAWLTYNRTSLMATTMAAYIRRLGYPARAHFESNVEEQFTWDVVVPPLLVLAGIGEMSRAGWALNPFLGGRYKAAVVTTDLPLLPDKPIDVGLQGFCRTCKRCAVDCPSRSISDSERMVEHNGYLRFDYDQERCTKYVLMNANGAFCARCAKVCPWNKPAGWSHDFVRWAIRRTPPLNRMWVRLDELFGYGKADERDRWWFDLEDIGWRHRVPPRSPDNLLWQSVQSAAQSKAR